MGRDPIKANANVYFQARKKAAEYNDALYSREGAAEKLGVSVSTLADYELGITKVIPVDKVVLMAELYNDPALLTRYCKFECPIHGYLPLATEEKNIQGIALRLLRDFDEDNLRELKHNLIDITEDGVISDDEISTMREILKRLEGVAEVISELKIVGEKYLKGK